MGNGASLNFCHFGEASVVETFDGALGDGEICEVDLIFFVQFLLISDVSFLFRLFQLVVVEVFSGLRSLFFDPFLEMFNIPKALGADLLLLFMHC